MKSLIAANFTMKDTNARDAMTGKLIQAKIRRQLWI